MVRIDDSADRTKCWLSFPDEKDELISTARSRDWERAIAIRLMAEVGCRASGVLSAKPAGIEYNSEGGYWQIEIKGKNTKGGKKTIRDAYLPDSVKQTLDIFADERNIANEEPYVDKSESTVRRWVVEAGKEMATKTTQLYEEAKHTDHFDRYWREVIHAVEDELGFDRSSPTSDEWFNEPYYVLFERDERAMNRLLTEPTSENLAIAYCH